MRNREVWKQLDSYNYEVSNLGRVRHKKYKRIRKPLARYDGYTQLHLRNTVDKRVKTIKIHKLVAMAFMENSVGAVIDHINRKRDDNRLENLRISSYIHNASNKATPLVRLVERVVALHNLGKTKSEILILLRKES